METRPKARSSLSREFGRSELLFLPWTACIWYFLFYSTSLKKSWLRPTWFHNTLMGHQCQRSLEGKFQTRQEYQRTGRENSVFACVGYCLVLSRVWGGQGADKSPVLSRGGKNTLYSCRWSTVQNAQEFHNNETFRAERSHLPRHFKLNQLWEVAWEQ